MSDNRLFARTQPKVSCRYCPREIAATAIKRHEQSCWQKLRKAMSLPPLVKREVVQ